MAFPKRLKICISLALAGMASTVFAQITFVPRSEGGYDIQNPDGTKTATRMSPRSRGGYEIKLRDGTTIPMIPRSGGGYEIQNRNGTTIICTPRSGGRLVCEDSKMEEKKTDRGGTQTTPSFRGTTMAPSSGGAYEIRNRDGTTTRVTPRPGGGYEIQNPDGTTTRMTSRYGGGYKILSTTTLLPRRSVSFAAKMRQSVSTAPPAGQGAISVIGRDGYSSARAG